MHVSLQKLNFVKNKVNEVISQRQLKNDPIIIVVTKTFSLNKIQEAENKWLEIRNQYSNLKLHMIGKLQLNKAKKAVKIFDYIHSLDNAKLASKIAQYEKELNKKTKLFIQVNLGEENQKSGILLNDLNNFYYYCKKELLLNVIGLMCLPPVESNSQKYFKILKSVAEKLNLKDLSMGMSSDFEQAIINGSTYLRLGTIILGERSSTR